MKASGESLTSTSTFLNDFQSHFSGIRICPDGSTDAECAVAGNPCYSCRPSSGQSIWVVSVVTRGTHLKFYLPSGEFVYVSTRGYNYQEEPAFWIDLNGIDKGPNRFGVDMFLFQVVDGNLLPYGHSDVEQDTTNDCIMSTQEAYQGGLQYFRETLKTIKF
jgi:hypothetical protein